MIRENFLTLLDNNPWEKISGKIKNAGLDDVDRVLKKNKLDMDDFAILLSKAAAERISVLKKKAHQLTTQYFGKARFLYAPLYITNRCINSCVYCSFSEKNDIKRKYLNDTEIANDAEYLHNQGFRHILVVSGEDPIIMKSNYLINTIALLHKKFPSISIEVQPLTESLYRKAAAAGCDGLSLYQETYNRDVYKTVHTGGPKRNFKWRINGPERAACAGIKRINFGVLLGLADFRTDIWFAALHAAYIRKNFWRTQIGFSFPRIRPFVGSYHPDVEVKDNDMLHLILALRIMFPQASLVLSTRERPKFRDMLLSVAATNTSAGSKTNPGGYSDNSTTGQFDISDKRSPSEVIEAISAAGLYPVQKDWDIGLTG